MANNDQSKLGGDQGLQREIGLVSFEESELRFYPPTVLVGSRYKIPLYSCGGKSVWPPRTPSGGISASIFDLLVMTS